MSNRLSPEQLPNDASRFTYFMLVVYPTTDRFVNVEQDLQGASPQLVADSFAKLILEEKETQELLRTLEYISQSPEVVADSLRLGHANETIAAAMGIVG